ncbi:kinase-like domain-containing protein [Mycena pura]|uniref:Kinase-like domain-containing protein n=1 Tax=Mycena pura TaxID=153505 RepID=A0AAD6YGV5_9AGAR|nr:kinase-like domain-containing protein [Mycena pura]
MEARRLWGYLEYTDQEWGSPECKGLIKWTRFDLDEDCTVVTIGRHKKNVICIPHIKSQLHATIRFHGIQNGRAQVTIEDEKSTNKTFVEATQVDRHEPRLLKDGQEISFLAPQPPPEDETTMIYFSSSFLYRLLLVKEAPRQRGISDHYELSATLGTGGFATVLKAYKKPGNGLFAVKAIFAVHSNGTCGRRNDPIYYDASGKSRTRHQDVVEREISVMKALDHPNVCKLHDYFWNRDESVDLVLEFVDGQDLFNLIRDNGRLSERRTKHLMRQFCKGLAFIHGKNIIHRDLKPETSGLQGHFQMRLQIYRIYEGSICGTVAYLSPEFVHHMYNDIDTGYGKPSDCFAGGIIWFDWLTGDSILGFLVDFYTNYPRQQTYRLEDVPRERIINWAALDQCVVEKEGYPIYISSEGKNFVRGLLVKEEKARLTMVEALAHSWFETD